MDTSLPPTSQPLPAFGNRSVMEIFTGAAAGSAEDQEAMGRISLLSVETTTVPSLSLLFMAEMWLKMALTRGRSSARAQLVNVLLLRALQQFDTDPATARSSLAEAVSYLDELAEEDDQEAAGNLDRLLANFVPVAGTPADRAYALAEAKLLRTWRDRYGALA